MKKAVLALVVVAAVAGAAWLYFAAEEGPTGPQALLQLLPGETTAALLMPDAADALADLKALKDRFQGRIAAVEPLIAEGSRLAGFDLNKPETMAEIGLRPGGGFATAAGVDWAALIFAVGDRAKFEGFVKRRFESELGGQLTWTSVDREGLQVRMARTAPAGAKADDKPTDVFGLAYIRGHAVVAPTRNWQGEQVDPAGSLLKVFRTTPQTALAARKDLMEPLDAVGLDRAAVIVTDLASGAELGAQAADDKQRPRDAEALRRAAKQVQGLAVGVDVGVGGVTLPFALSGPDAAVRKALAAFTPAAQGPDYAKVAPPDGMLLLSLAFNPTGLMPWLREQLMDYERKVVDGALKDSNEKSGTDFEKQVLPLLSGHLGFVFTNLDIATVGQRLLQNLGASSTIAMEKPGAITTTTFIGLKDGPGMVKLIEESVAKAEEAAGGSLPTLKRVEGRAAWRVTQDDEEVIGFAVHDKTLVLTTGVGRLDGAMARLAGTDKASKSLGDRVIVADAKQALSSKQNVALFVSVPVIFGNFPLLNLWRPAAPAKLVAEAALTTQVTAKGIRGELLVTLPPPPDPSTAGGAK